MILTDREIKLSVNEGLIEIKPNPDQSAYSSTSVDLTLDHNIRVFTNKTISGLETIIDPASSGYKFNEAIGSISELLQITDEGYLVPPGKLMLGWTKQRIHLKPTSRVAARVEGKSSLARLGLAVHVTAPTIHAGFQGQIQLEIINHGPIPIRLRAGMSICQLIFEMTLGIPDLGYSGQFSGQHSSNT